MIRVRVQKHRAAITTAISVRSALAPAAYGAQHPAVRMCLAIRQVQTAAAARMVQNNAAAAHRRPVQKAAGRMKQHVLRIRFAAAVRASHVQVASMFIIIHAKITTTRTAERTAVPAIRV